MVLELLSDPPGFFGTVPDRYDIDLFAAFRFGPKLLDEPRAVVSNDRRGRCQNVRGRAVILLQLDHLRAGKVLLKTQDIFHLRAAPRVDRLVIIPDHTDILARLGEQPEPKILDAVGILIFVDEDIFEALLILLQHIAVRFQDCQNVQKQITEIAGIESLETILISCIKVAALTIRKTLAFARINV